MPFYGSKLPSSTVSASLDWQPSAEFWEAVTLHAGEMRPDQQHALIHIVRRYIASAELENSATPTAHSEARLKEIKHAAETFWRVLDSPGAGSGSEAVHHVESLLNDYSARRTTKAFRLSHLSSMMLTFVEACDRAEAQIEELKTERDNFKPLTAWRMALIKPLGEFWERGLRKPQPKIRKDTDVVKADVSRKDDPFVLIVMAIEKALPKALRYPANSHEAYLAAISNALPGRREKKVRERSRPKMSVVKSRNHRR